MSIWEHNYNRLRKDNSDISYLLGFWEQIQRTKVCCYCNQSMISIIEKEPIVPSEVDTFIFDFKDPRPAFVEKPTKMDKFEREKWERMEESHAWIIEEYLRACPCCGWWVRLRNDIIQNQRLRTWGGIAGLKKLDVTDIALPLAEARNYLAANYEERFKFHPRKMEEIVADIFKDLGYRVRVTAYSGDDGIDVILEGKDDVLVGVQVKRYKNSIGVAQIRELTGALVINGMTKGIFVTTSSFESGAERTAGLSAAKGFPIELYNAEKLFDALKLAQLSQNKDATHQWPMLELIGEMYYRDMAGKPKFWNM